MGNNDEKKVEKRVPAVNRFVVSYRRAGKRGDLDKLKSARDVFERTFARQLTRHVTILSHNEEASEEKRGIKIFDADYLEMNKLKKELPADLIIERLITRKPAVALPFNVSLSAYQPVGRGDTIEFFTKSGDKPLADISAGVNFVLKAYPTGGGSSVSLSSETDSNGKVVFEYDSNVWLPVGAMFEPKHSYWMPAPATQFFDKTINFIPLPKTGPFGWWHHMIGISIYDPNLGSGIKIGAVDTGGGPNSNLSNLKSVGAFIDGKYDNRPDAALDSTNHGTHVCGIIAASPPWQSNDFVGIAPGAEVYTARVFPKDLNATQGDIANAIDTLVSEHGVHLINMSLGSGEPSEIELDAIRFAMEHGALCICAAGNDNGGPVCFPAAYAETVAVSALGLLGMYPPGTLSSWFTPKELDKFGMGGSFLASYSNIGNTIVCCAPGTGIISTVPATSDYPAPYLAMDGTSMSAPMVTGAVAACLSKDERFKIMPPDLDRFGYVVQVAMVVFSNSLNLSPLYQGYGMVNIRPFI